MQVRMLYFLLHASREGHDVRISETSSPWKADFHTNKMRYGPMGTTEDRVSFAIRSEGDISASGMRE